MLVQRFCGLPGRNAAFKQRYLFPVPCSLFPAICSLFLVPCYLLLGGCALTRGLGGFVGSGAAAAEEALRFSLTGGTDAVELGEGALSFHYDAGRRNRPSRIIVDGGGMALRRSGAEGPLLEVGNNMELTLRNIVLEGYPGNRGCLVRVTGGGKLILETGASILGNGAGVHVESGTLIMRDGVIGGMESGYGARIELQGALVMEGGAIQDNAAGGVFVDGGSFTMNGGAIRGNRTEGDGGGAHIDGGSFVMNGGLISGNTAGGNGGGARVIGVFDMRGGIISDNAAGGDGGGVYVASGGAFIKSGGVVIGSDEAGAALRSNSAARGRAAFAYESASRFKQRETTAGAEDDVAFKGAGHADNAGWEDVQGTGNR